MIHDMTSKCHHSNLIKTEVVSEFGAVNNVVELGCADGQNLIALSTTIGYGLGIEPNARNFDIANKNAQRYENITVVKDDHRHLTHYENATFDLCLTCSVIDHIEPDDLDECIRLLTSKCRNLLLIEPAIMEEHRQATADETAFWTNTWYYDYWQIFKNHDCAITPFPLYPANSGPRYKKIVVRGGVW